jgi:8-oxo-dGTP pyrophosphatase MutT (NUDIX family)
MNPYQESFPHLFEEYIPPDKSLRMKFEFGTKFPNDLVGTVKMIAYIGDQYLALRVPSGWWEPGGKRELGENYLEAIKREMLEETGCRVLDFTLFGAFHCVSLEDTPPEPGLLWPEFYFLWGYGEVEIVSEPSPNPNEKILEVGWASLAETCARLQSTTGAGTWLNEIYQLADKLRQV